MLSQEGYKRGQSGGIEVGKDCEGKGKCHGQQGSSFVFCL